MWEAFLVGVTRMDFIFDRDNRRSGRVGSIFYEVELSRAPVSYGLNVRTLYKGGGRISRLSLWREKRGCKERLALYARGWRYGRKKHLGAVLKVVRHLGVG